MAKPLNLPRRGARVEWRIFFTAVLFILGLGALVAKLWWEQVARGREWAKRIAGRSQVTVRIPSVRGEIRDRNGVTLVANRASYEVDFYLPDMVRGYKQQHDGKVPLTKFKAPVKQMLTEKSEADVVRIVNDTVVPRLDELDLAIDINTEHLQKHYRNDTLVPFTYREDLDFATLARFSEHNVGLPGVDIAIRPVRQYVYGALASHLLGYVGAPNDIKDLHDVNDYTFYQPDVEGKSQVELKMEKYLRGTPGVRVLQRNVKGVIEGEIKRVAPKPGNNVYLTLDARIQTIVEQALRHPVLGRAAAVVVDPNNGDILGMGSVPSFDPNVFIPSVSSADWKKLNDDEAVPLINRAVSGFPPGSTFKIVTAMAGLTKKMQTARFNCPGGISYGDHYFKCWIAEKHGQHGTLGLNDAIKVSCDSFFYQYGNAAGIENIVRIGKLLGLGEPHDLGLLDEKAGVMPGPEWLRTHYPQEKWTSAYTANVSIGQGYVLASPLQMAMAYAAVANGGIAYEPRLVRTVLTPEGQPTRDESGQIAVPDQPKVRGDLRNEMTREQIDVVRNGLRAVVNDGGGTGGKARLKNVVVAGKTGTAQASDRGNKEHIAWFCCFAPFDHPRYAICAMVENGEHGGGVAAPIAAHILEQCLAMDQGTLNVEVAALTPSRNSNPFAVIKELPAYNNAAAIKLAVEEESAGAKESNAKIDMGGGGAHPDIRPDANQAGKIGPRGAPKPQVDKRSFFERFFSLGRKPAPPAPDRRAPLIPFRPGGR